MNPVIPQQLSEREARGVGDRLWRLYDGLRSAVYVIIAGPASGTRPPDCGLLTERELWSVTPFSMLINIGPARSTAAASRVWRGSTVSHPRTAARQVKRFGRALARTAQCDWQDKRFEPYRCAQAP